MELWPILVGLVVAAVVVSVILMGRRAARKRAEAMQATAVDMGFAFEAQGDVGQLAALGDFPLYSHGHSKAAINVMTGRSGGRDMKVFDYRYTTGGGKNSHTWNQTVAVYPGVARGLPDFVLAPERFVDRIAQIFGYQDIDFESNPVFSKEYLLRGPDETAIRAAFGIDTLSFLECQPGWTIEVRSGNVAIYRSGRRLDPGIVPSFLAESQALLAALTHR